MNKIQSFVFACATLLLVFTVALPIPVTKNDAKLGASRSRTKAVTQVGPLDLSGELNGAPYRIRVPAVWNGTLLVFAHGYRDKADHPVKPTAANFPAALGFNHGFVPPAFSQP